MSAAYVVAVLLPLRIVSEANQREHWRKVAQRKKQHRQTALAVLWPHAKPVTDGPITITLTRIAPRVLDDDNLASGFKAARDGVADWLGIDDGDKRLLWQCEQRKGKPGQYAAEVNVMWSL